MLIHARHLEKCREALTGLLAERTGQSREKLAAGMERDCFLDAQEALDYGLVDQVL
ncbi:MAG: ATP-dependent Clp protease proteolytic subunit [Lawsonibacter sp.]|nr:ATP-dependent Clp protease proteolytic subunit [Lawsonibacter sp.]